MSTLRTNTIESLDGQSLATVVDLATINKRTIYVGSVAAMEALSISVGANVKTLGYYTPGDGGGNDYEVVAGATGTADGGSFIDLNNGLQAKGLFFGGVSVKQFGAKADGVTDDVAALQAAVNHGNKIYVPSGTYRTRIVYLNSNTELFGDGDSTVLQRFDNNYANNDDTLASNYILATYAFDQGTSNTDDNKRNIHVHDIKLDGRRRDFGGSSFIHNMTINATSDITVERVNFYDFQGDGIYAGSGTVNGIERHNERIVIRDCIFDGVVKDNRNGLSVIDCDKITVDNCEFKNIGNATLSQSVGGIDFEPNASTAIYRDVIIKGCRFFDLNSVNTSAITFFTSLQSPENMRTFTIRDCEFIGCFWAISMSTGSNSKDTESVIDDVLIENNRFFNSVSRVLRTGSVRGLKFRGNVVTSDNLTGSSQIDVGNYASNTYRPAVDVTIGSNLFSYVSGQQGLIQLVAYENLRIKDNQFIDVDLYLLQFQALDATATNRRVLSNIKFDSNIIEYPRSSFLDGSVTAYRIVNVNGDLNNNGDNSLINSGSSFKDNVYEELLDSTDSRFLLEGGNTNSALSTGTWSRGDTVQKTVPNVGGTRYHCDQDGTFGTLTGVTGDVTNGNRAILNVADANYRLRVGQYVSIGASTRVYRVKKIVGTTVYVHFPFDGTTATGAAITWSAPTFILA